VLHADETPVQMLAPGKKKTHQAYVCAYASTSFSDNKGVVYDFAPNRSGEHARAFLKTWQGKLVCSDFAGYKEGFKQGIIEIGCMAMPDASYLTCMPPIKGSWLSMRYNISACSMSLKDR
jgi:transposase